MMQIISANDGSLTNLEVLELMQVTKILFFLSEYIDMNREKHINELIPRRNEVRTQPSKTDNPLSCKIENTSRKK